jgi:hypothetical protein
VLQVKTEIGYELVSSSYDKLAINTPIKNTLIVTINTKNDGVPDYFTLKDVADLQYFMQWLRAGVYQYNEAYIIRDTYRITIRRGERISEEKDPFEPYFAKLNLLKDVENKDIPHENRTEVSVPGCTITDNKRYGNYGGFACT